MTEDDMPQATGSAAQLQSFVRRCENLLAERAEINADLRALRAEIKAAGFSVPVVMARIAERTLGADVVETADAMREVYRVPLGLPATVDPGSSAELVLAQAEEALRADAAVRRVRAKQKKLSAAVALEQLGQRLGGGPAWPRLEHDKIN
jgi:uncharacterized protein (UPF0335 family)